MAYGFAAVPAVEIANKVADLLLLAASHAAAGLDTVTSRWAAGNAGTTASADVTHADTPIDWIGDKYGHKRCKPNAAGTAHTLVLDFDTPQTVDGILIWGENLRPLDVNLQVDIADTGAFVAGLQTIATVTPVDSDRIMLLDLLHTGSDPLRYTDLEFMRLIFEASASFTPEIAEVWPFRRRQLGETFLRGFNPNLTVSDVSRRRSRSGVISSNTRSSGQSLTTGSLVLEEPDITTLLALWDDMEHGTEEIIRILEPETNPNEGQVIVVTPRLALPTEGEDLRRWALSGEEQIPYVSSET